MLMRNTDKPYNEMDRYASDISHILIPLPNFKHYHQTESESIGDNGFIGRRTIICKLKNWITNKKTMTGAYLVTGYRGMGKSSFVGRVLYELTQHHRYVKERYFQIVKGILLILTISSCVLRDNEVLLHCTLLAMIIGGCYLYILHRIKLARYVKAVKEDKNKVDNGNIHTEYIPVRINIGNELLSHNDEILRLIIKSVYENFSDYTQRPAKHLCYSYVFLCLQLALIIVVVRNLTFIPISVSSYNKLGILQPFCNGFENFARDYSMLVLGIAGLVCYFASIYLLEKLSILIDKVHFLGLTTLEGIKNQMHNLYLRSIAAIDEDYSSIWQKIPMILKKKKYEKASVREMEQSLISIFNKVDELKFRLGFMRFHLRFIIVLDELDKVDTSQEDILSDSENDDSVPSFETSVNGFSGTLNARKRKQELMKTLGNMKYFLSTVKAKFIFIAGRELYDAYLGDVSDREFSISSVFDGIININSFFKAGDSSMDITAMTEEYICQRLMPENEPGERNLANYHKYSNKTYPGKEKRNHRNTAFLYQYVMYLVHLSNGSPKKIAVYFEKDIRSREHLTSIKHFKLEDDFEYYLSFGTKDIQKVGFIHYLSYPIMQAMVSKSKIYEDKLLVSTAFMINHIYKYHNTGFSWRNLEHIPELLDMNKTPELRDFLGTIIGLLGQTHLSPIQSGLYLFKFPMKISEEISFLSKRIEDISAMFHFSKDESLPVKRHYMHLLDYYTEKRNCIEGEELHTLASIHHILADIYQADEDYSLAIYEYLTGLQLLSKQLQKTDFDKEPHWISGMLFLVRNMLKLGTAYEKRKTFDSAYTAYSELGSKLIDYRLLKERKLKLQYNMENNEPMERKAILFYKKGYKPYNDRKEKLQVQEWTDDPSFEYAFPADQLAYEFSRILSPVKYSILIRQSFFYDLRLAYLPILAKLFVLEKMDTEGITFGNLDLAESEFFYLHVFVNDTDKPMIYADFFQKLGDILYYKNGLIETACDNIFQAISLNGFDLKTLSSKLCKLFSKGKNNSPTYYDISRRINTLFNSKDIKERNSSSLADLICIEMNSSELKMDVKNILKKILDNISANRIKRCMEHREKILKSGNRLPCYACKYYNMSFGAILKRILNYEINSNQLKSVNIMIWLLNHRSVVKGMKESNLLLIANTIKGLANVMLSCSDQNSIIREVFLSKLFFSFRSFYEMNKNGQSNMFEENDISLTSLEKSLLLYVEAGMFFDKAGHKNNAVQMFRQILEVLDSYLRVVQHKEGIAELPMPQIQDIKTHLKDIQMLVNYIIKILYGHYDSVNMLEIEKLKRLFGKDIEEDVQLHRLPLSPDIEELIYRYYSLEIRCGRFESIKKIYTSSLMGHYKQISTLSQDIQNLRFKFLMNEVLFFKIVGIKRNSYCNPMQDLVVQTLRYFMEEKPNVFAILESYGIKAKDRSFMGKVNILNYFIVDNLSCLSKIANVLQPLNNPTIFTSYFLGDINLYTEFWKSLYDGLYLMYKDADRCSASGSLNLVDEKSVGEHEKDYLKIKSNPNYQHLCHYIGSHKYGGSLSENLKKYLLTKVEGVSFERLSWNYNAELAILNYNKAIEMHTEGRAYKEMITGLFFLDDDLNNDTIQQNLAIERYLINSNDIHRRINLMRNRLSSSRIFNVEYYFDKYN